MLGSLTRKTNRQIIASMYHTRAVRLQVSTATVIASSLKYPQMTNPATTRLQIEPHARYARDPEPDQGENRSVGHPFHNLRLLPGAQPLYDRKHQHGGQGCDSRSQRFWHSVG